MSCVIVEGPDGAGKTTLIEAMRKRYRWSAVDHHRAYIGEKQIARYYVSSLYSGLTPRARTQILDRSWLAEPIYGKVMRGGENRITTWQRRMLERVALGAQTVVVFAMPPRAMIIDRWRERLEREYPKKIAEISDIIDGYETLFTERLRSIPFPVVSYDYTKQGSPAQLKSFFWQLDEVRGKLTRTDPTIGAASSTEPRALLLGDRPGGGGVNLPFVSLISSYTTSGCSVWLTEQLEEWGIPEHELAWANTEGLDPGAFLDFGRYRKIVALGGNATAWAERYGVPHTTVPHPQFWKRFHYNEEYPLREVLCG